MNYIRKEIFCIIVISVAILYNFFEEYNKPKSYNITDVPRDDIITIYFQGMQTSRSQAAKYAGSLGLHTKINHKTEHIYIPNAPLILHNIYLYDELEDTSYGYTLNPLQLIYKCLSFLKIRYFNIWQTNLQRPSVPHHYFSNLNAGGDQDRNQFLNAIKLCIEEYPDKKIVLFGTSRGAATVLASLPFLTEVERIHIKLVLVEAPFDTLPNILKYQFGRLSSLPLYLLEKFGKYRPGQFSPLDSVSDDKFPLDLPIGFITSEVDNVVPKVHTTKLINKLKERNHTKLHLLELQNSGHSSMSVGDSTDQKLYIEFVNKLYDNYCK